MKFFKSFFKTKYNDDSKGANKNQSLDLKKYILSNSNDNIIVCPNCGIQIDKKPKRKTKCKNCFKFIFIKKDSITDEYHLITEKENNIIKLESQKTGFRNYWLCELNEYGVVESDFFKKKEEFILKNGYEINDSDLIWSIFNELIVVNINDLFKVSRIYHSMAVFLLQEGKDNFLMLQESLKFRIYFYEVENKNSNMILDLKIISNTKESSCIKCSKLNGKILDFKEALETMPIPNKDCKHCMAMYVAEARRDNCDNLIFKK